MKKNILPILITMVLAFIPYNSVLAATGDPCEIGVCLSGSVGAFLLILALGLAFGVSLWLRSK